MLLLTGIELLSNWARTHTVTSTLLVATVVFLLLRWLLTRKKNFPPGPWGLPYFGYVQLVLDGPHLRLDKLSKKYGDVFSLNLGGRSTIILNSFSAIKEAFSNPAYSGHPPDSIFEMFKKPGDLPTPDGEEWTKIRRFTLHLFRDLGLGKAKLEELMREEVTQFLQEVKQRNGEPFYFRMLLIPSIANNIGVLTFGKRFERGYTKMKLFSEPQEPTRLVCMVGVLMFFPLAKFLFRMAMRFSPQKMFEVNRLAENHLKAEIESHKKDIDESSPYKDFIDGFLREMEKHKGVKSNTAFQEPTLRECIMLLLGAGTETVTTTIEWACLIMAEYPEIQQKVQTEIDDVVGRERIPCWEDHYRLPYVEAVLMEIQRWVSLVPINLLRYTLEDTKLKGYDIPKGTTVIANLWSVHHDPTAWKDPENFIPERFLSDDGKTVVKPDQYIPFSYGKRSCLGEPLGIQESFLYFTAIMQTFNVRLPAGKKADFQGILAIAYAPKRQDLCFVARDGN